eukprot:NODE_7890_length_731_cov_22.569079_g7275_i0.p1 GENE.NODE_7890_length_731_cov_22.569079_g7275_i0~~NODE_7890_length_731_cov_22.569079_g7275_i0.p1  ORF type:complete len:173 (+),score=27.31 NODE_7890_length_731_cov_22.569079_g7275_i0:72-590(+)
MLNTWKSCETYYCLDAWRYQENYEDVANVVQETQDKLYNEAKSRLQKFGNKVVFVRAFSNQAINKFNDLSIDFIYIDARHDYEGVSEDLRLYWPKLRKGGILAGHDYVNVDEVAAPERARWGKQDWSIMPNGSKRTDNKAVRSAVNEFASQHNRQIVITYEDGYWPTWVMRK